MTRLRTLYSDRELFARRRSLASRQQPDARADRFTETGEGLRFARDGRDITDEVHRLAAASRDPGVTPTHASPTTEQ